jgi:spoIIIJ-associated protein
VADEVDTTGKTVEEAVKLALLELNATLDEVDIKIVDSGAPGHVLGIGAREAQVRVTRRDSPYPGDEDDAPPPPAPRQPRPRASAPPPPAPRQPRPRASAPPESSPPPPPRQDSPAEDRPADSPADPTEDPPEAEIDVEDVAEVANDIIKGLIERMGFDASVERTDGDLISFNVVGDSEALDPLIGPNGETLRAFGFLVNSMLGRMARSSVRVIIDVDGYRQRREEELREFALDIAEEVRENDEPITLEAMPAHERRMIHMALAESEDIRTYSIGEGRERRVVIGPAV